LAVDYDKEDMTRIISEAVSKDLTIPDIRKLLQEVGINASDGDIIDAIATRTDAIRDKLEKNNILDDKSRHIYDRLKELELVNRHCWTLLEGDEEISVKNKIALFGKIMDASLAKAKVLQLLTNKIEVTHTVDKAYAAQQALLSIINNILESYPEIKKEFTAQLNRQLKKININLKSIPAVTEVQDAQYEVVD